jgi:hypothetical protein
MYRTCLHHYYSWCTDIYCSLIQMDPVPLWCVRVCLCLFVRERDRVCVAVCRLQFQYETAHASDQLADFFCCYFQFFVTVCVKTLNSVILNPGFPQIVPGINVAVKGLNLSTAPSSYFLLVVAK